jgi:hypothetical protein
MGDFLNTQTHEAIEKIVKEYNDRIYIYSILCNRSEVYYNRLKFFCSVPVILISSLMSVLNSNLEQNILKNFNIIFNALTAFILAFSNLMKVNEKVQEFKDIRKKFNALDSLIEMQLAAGGGDGLTSDFATNVIKDYDNIVDNMNFEIPDHICRNVYKQYKNQKVLPIVLHGMREESEYKNTDILYEKKKSLNEVLKTGSDF